MAATKKTVVVCDDDESIVEAIKIILEDHDFAVKTLTQGNAFSAITTQNPNVVLIDIFMAGTDGATIVKKLKADKKYRDIPVVVCSANVKIEKIAKECGANDYLAKPFDIKDLLDVVNRNIR